MSIQTIEIEPPHGYRFLLDGTNLTYRRPRPGEYFMSVFGLALYEASGRADGSYFIIVEDKRVVPLTFSDIPQGSVFRRIGRPAVFPHGAIVEDGVEIRVLGGYKTPTFEELQGEWEIWRPGDTEWRKCEKEV